MIFFLKTAELVHQMTTLRGSQSHQFPKNGPKQSRAQKPQDSKQRNKKYRRLIKKLLLSWILQARSKLAVVSC